MSDIDNYYKKILCECVILPDRESSPKFYNYLSLFLGCLSNVFDNLSKHSKDNREASIKRVLQWTKSRKFSTDKVNPAATRYFVSIIYAVRVLRKSFINRDDVKAFLDERIHNPVYEEGCFEKCLEVAQIQQKINESSSIGEKRKRIEVTQELARKRLKVINLIEFS